MSTLAARIRLARPADAEGILAIYAPLVRETVVSFESHPPSAEEMARRIETNLTNLPWLVAETDNAIAGYAYATPYRSRDAYRWSVESSVYVHPDHRGVRHGTRLYQALFSILRGQGIRNVYGGIALPNDASVAIHESLGFEPIGVYRNVGYKLGAWHDVGWWGLALDPDADAPSPPRRLGLMRCEVEELIQRGLAER